MLAREPLVIIGPNGRAAIIPHRSFLPLFAKRAGVGLPAGWEGSGGRNAEFETKLLPPEQEMRLWGALERSPAVKGLDGLVVRKDQPKSQDSMYPPITPEEISLYVATFAVAEPEEKIGFERALQEKLRSYYNARDSHSARYLELVYIICRAEAAMAATRYYHLLGLMEDARTDYLMGREKLQNDTKAAVAEAGKEPKEKIETLEKRKKFLSPAGMASLVPGGVSAMAVFELLKKEFAKFGAPGLLAGAALAVAGTVIGATIWITRLCINRAIGREKGWLEKTAGGLQEKLVASLAALEEKTDCKIARLQADAGKFINKKRADAEIGAFEAAMDFFPKYARGWLAMRGVRNAESLDFTKLEDRKIALDTVRKQAAIYADETDHMLANVGGNGHNGDGHNGGAHGNGHMRSPPSDETRQAA